MLLYVTRRILYAIPIALSVGLVCFMLVHIAPGDPVNAIVPPDAPQAVVDQVRRAYGLDKPLPIQFAIWLGHVLQGDLGRSLATGRPVWEELRGAVANTLRLAVVASLLGLLIGSVLGGLSGVFRGRFIDRAATTIAVAGVSVPHYWLGMVLVIIFSACTLNCAACRSAPGRAAAGSWSMGLGAHEVSGAAGDHARR